MPFETPYSVILSPIHMVSMLPATKIIVTMMNNTHVGTVNCAPNIALSNDDTTVTAKVTLGNNRNAGCRRISLGGDVKDTIDCSDSGATFDINENDLNTREITVTATVVPQRDASSGTGKSSFVPQYKVQPPTDGTATNRNSLDFRMSPWAKCNTASVQQVFNGATSDAVTGGPHNGAPYTY